MPSVRAMIPGDPVAWARTGQRRLPGGQIVRFENPKVRSYKAVLQQHLQQAMEVRGQRAPLFDGPVRVTIIARWSLARSHHRKRTPVPAGWRGGRPDIDNIVKLVLDAGTGLLWNDDDQVAHLAVVKLTAAQGDAAFLGVAVEDARPDELPVGWALPQPRFTDEESDAC